MIAKAKAFFVRISPYKLRLVADLVRGKNAEEALRTIPFVNKKGAKIVGEVLKSAIANAMNEGDASLHEDELFISRIIVDGGPTMARFKAGAQGRVKPFKHRTSHICIELDRKKN
ncbi:MAG TPA: 50S ribosomal protein L22 [candidate division Zixibacteria bacterium]|nr:50S ribosomal protein L22 [candidate division Zixibacteria bacterium]